MRFNALRILFLGVGAADRVRASGVVAGKPLAYETVLKGRQNATANPVEGSRHCSAQPLASRAERLRRTRQTSVAGRYVGEESLAGLLVRRLGFGVLQSSQSLVSLKKSRFVLEPSIEGTAANLFNPDHLTSG